ncbi:unnamed protein product [Effrenium voratum]|uniref:Uncharacterized protein n=1 Tax=Effrenium voratum TaxID=2562239 RepID=A0AA36N628_9DINO|nr:unnamed protein product [Effrenium voratum]
MAADFSYDRERVAWADIKSGRHQLSRQDVVIVDRAKYAGNIGSILRHMPILGGAQVLFLANSGHRPDSPYPIYPRSFVKEVMRVSMARNYKDFKSKLCILEGGDGKEELLELAQILKRNGFCLVALENREVFEDKAQMASLSYHSIYAGAMPDAPAAFVFGGEVQMKGLVRAMRTRPTPGLIPATSA